MLSTERYITTDNLADRMINQDPVLLLIDTRTMEEFEKYNVFWFEEPISNEDIDGYIEVSRALDMHVAAGECEFTRYGNFILGNFTRIDNSKTSNITLHYSTW